MTTTKPRLASYELIADQTARLKDVPVNAIKLSPWADRHLRALEFPQKEEVPIVRLLQALLYYCKCHESSNDSYILADYVLGDGVSKIAEGIRILLNGERRRLDCGTIDSLLCDLLIDGED